MSVYLTCRSELIKVTVKMFDLREISVLLNYFCWHYRTGGRFEPRQREPVKNLVTYPLILRQTFTASYFTRKYVIYFRTNWITNKDVTCIYAIHPDATTGFFLLLFVCLFNRLFVCLIGFLGPFVRLLVCLLGSHFCQIGVYFDLYDVNFFPILLVIQINRCDTNLFLTCILFKYDLSSLYNIFLSQSTYLFHYLKLINICHSMEQ